MSASTSFWAGGRAAARVTPSGSPRPSLHGASRACPVNATPRGAPRSDDTLDAVPPKARAGWTARYRRTLDELPKKVDRTKLSRSAQIDYDIFKHHLTRLIWLDEN